MPDPRCLSSPRRRPSPPSGVAPLLLDTQYRMHPLISAFPSAYFYGGKLRDGVAAADKPVPRVRRCCWWWC